MALTFNMVRGNGSTLNYPIITEGGFLEDEDIVVELIDVTTGVATQKKLGFHYTISSGKVIFTSPPQNTHYVMIRRSVSLNNTFSNFQRGSRFGKDNLNNSFSHALYQLQQLSDGFIQDDFFFKRDVSMGNHRITNLRAGSDLTDAVTLGQLRSVLTGGTIIIDNGDTIITNTEERFEAIENYIDSVIAELRGKEPELYSPTKEYHLGDTCKTEDGRYWRSIYNGVMVAIPPPNEGYWERYGVLMVGDIDGEGMVGIDGSLVVNGTITASKIAAGAISAVHLNSSSIFSLSLCVGAGSSGYYNFIDRPRTLADINAAEFALLGGSDAGIVIWFYDYDPTLENIPASTWETDDAKNEHLSDLFYNTSTGKPYVFSYYGGTYFWDKIEDEDLQSALELASTALDTADSKRRLFTATPVPPYDVGDMWDSPNGVKRAVKARTAGESYLASDWVLIADITGNNVALDTAFVAGVAAAIIKANANKGAYIYDNAGNLAYADAVSMAMLDSTIIVGGYIKTSLIQTSAIYIGSLNGAGSLATRNTISTAQLDSTIISGGYIKTSLLNVNSILVSAPVTGEVEFTSSGKISFVSNTSHIYGTSSLIYMGLVNGGGYINVGSAGAYIYTNGVGSLKSEGNMTVKSYDGNVYLDADSTHGVYFAFEGSTKAYVNAWGLVPSLSNHMTLGSSSQYLQACYATAFYDNGGGYNDDQDDLDVLHTMKPKLDSNVEVRDSDGLMVLDINTIPDYMTNKVELRKELSDEFNEGVALSDSEFDNLMLLPNVKSRVKRNLIRFVDIGVGAIRQLDIENSELIEQLGDWLADIESRLRLLEQ